MEGDASHDNTNPLQIQKWVGGKQFWLVTTDQIYHKLNT